MTIGVGACKITALDQSPGIYEIPMLEMQGKPIPSPFHSPSNVSLDNVTL